MDMVLTPRGLRMGNRTIPCSIGLGGLTQHKREGDGSTPVGTHRIVGMLYRPDRMERPADWAIPIKPFDLWSDDVCDIDYNMMVRAPHHYSHEILRRSDPMYDLVILTNWNWPYPKKGAGSAIFIHEWHRPHAPTAGCIGLSRANLLWVAKHIRYETQLIIPPLAPALRK
jgi:L,D-peptidoglycan transpeptidase YkuD (ErfK/YbiS/YcfS/YnhG family)